MIYLAFLGGMLFGAALLWVTLNYLDYRTWRQ